jgi:hypothetical protein
MSRRAAAFKYLHGKKDKRISDYNTEEVIQLLTNNDVHSPELTDAGQEKDEKDHMYVNVYGLSWRSKKVIFFCCIILVKIRRLIFGMSNDIHSISFDTPKINRIHNKIQYFKS